MPTETNPEESSAPVHSWLDGPIPRKLSERRLLPAVLIVLLLIRILLIPILWRVPFSSDAIDYTYMAHLLVDGTRFVPYWPPGLPFFLAVPISLGLNEAFLRVEMLVFWILCCWGLVRLAKDFGLSRFNWLIVLVFGILPASIQMSIDPLTQLPVAALFLLALSATVRCVRDGKWSEVLTLALSMGYMALVRPSSALLMLLFPAAMVFKGRRHTKAAVCVVLAASLVGAWVVRAHQLSGHWLINTANSKNLWYGNNPRTPLYKTWYFGSHDKDAFDNDPDFVAANALGAVKQADWFSQQAKSYIEHHPLAFLLRTFNRFCSYWAFDTFTSLQMRHFNKLLFACSLFIEASLYLLLAGFSIFAIVQRGREFWRDWKVQLVAAAIVLYALPYWVSMSHPTYHYPILAPFFLLGLYAWSGLPRGLPWRNATKAALVVFLLIQVEWVWQMSSSIR